MEARRWRQTSRREWKGFQPLRSERSCPSELRHMFWRPGRAQAAFTGHRPDQPPGPDGIRQQAMNPDRQFMCIRRSWRATRSSNSDGADGGARPEQPDPGADLLQPTRRKAIRALMEVAWRGLTSAKMSDAPRRLGDHEHGLHHASQRFVRSALGIDRQLCNFAHSDPGRARVVDLFAVQSVREQSKMIDADRRRHRLCRGERPR